MSDGSYHSLPVAIPIPQSSDIRTYFFNWRLTCSLTHPFQHTHFRHLCNYHPHLCFATSPFYIVQCSGTHCFEFLSPDHGYPLLVVQFTIEPTVLTYLPLTYTSPCTTYSCPVVYVIWHNLPFFPPNHNLEALELPTDGKLQLDFFKDFLCQLIQYYYSPLAP